MARFFPIYCGLVLMLGAVSARSQATRPMFPAPRPQPAQTQVNPQPATPATTPMGQPQPSVTTPNPGPQQQNPQPQQAPRPQDPPPTTPPSPPTVVYRDGLLSVQAVNSTLSGVLTAIRNKTGIEFEGLENVQDRVALSLGPAPAGEVLSSIFAGTKFDFVAVGRPDNPAIVQRVIISPKGRPGAVAGAQPQLPANAGQEGDEEDTPDEQVNTEPQDTPVQPPVQPPQAQTQPPEAQQQQQPKTPDQLLQELQEMRSKQQQGQDDQNPSHVPRKQPPQ